MKRMIRIVMVGWLALGVTAQAALLFQANYNGNTGNGGLDADFAAGSAIATATTGVSLAPGVLGTGARFPSNTSANVSLQYNAASNIQNDQGTLEFWYKPDADSSSVLASDSRLFNVRNTAGNRFIDLFLADVNGAAPGGEALGIFSDTFGGQNSTPLGSFSAGDLLHLALTWDNTAGIRLFVNGVASGLFAHAWAANSHVQDVLFVGSSIFGSVSDAQGVIDIVRISDNVKYPGNFDPFADPQFIPEPSIGMLLLAGAACLVAWKKSNRE